jgi:hypothetical protein
MSRIPEGVSIELRGRADRLLYSQDGRSLTIDCEPLLGGSVRLLIYARSIQKWDDGTPIDAFEKHEILQNVKDYLAPQWGEDIEIQDN